MRLVIICALLFSVFSSQAGASLFPNVVVLQPDRIYVPAGFDDNDNAQVVFEGVYSNSCYRMGVSSYELVNNNRTITISNNTYFYPESMCLMVLVPYQNTIDFGILPEGDYKLVFKDRLLLDHKMGVLRIGKAKSMEPDDYLYAPILSVNFSPGSGENLSELTLKGEFTSTCMSMDRVKVIRPKGTSTIEILPIVKMESKNCQETVTPFEHKLTFPASKGKRSLLHIRSLNGNAINRIVNL